MKMKYKIFILVGILSLLLFGSGITYSVFHSSASLNNNDQKIATFVFNAEKLDHLEFGLSGLTPGNTENYNFSVRNNSPENTSNITIDYQITIKTYHFIPLNIELYKIDGNDENLIINCNESYSRNTDNELVCNSAIQEMNFDKEVIDDYIIKVRFPKEYDDEIYADLVDYIDVDIKSYQKTEE